ncbi:hypothetical protein BCD64_20375 [Nostoc sp. MBR 210]|uniref:Uncharacterized protein n=2 Tax=Nostoc TaxID=1177 RepID=A0A0M3V6Z3_9NOSO|nr:MULTISPECIES: hypothetical protein [Nostoc]ALF56287.1 hypothetical protein ACX27_06750 [Nostoc piscinale CENA21]MBD2592751.1 hypothetical protein [Nostoc spongiaeforme FACHB-130]OCQ94843.1 hypothetical protein BCD64_20375 [Nostoc sp. MBR 210]
MTPTSAASNLQYPADTEIWYSLKCAIAASSGFQRWQLERNTQLQGLLLEQQVQKYLRETLETLAY